jgi:hypothetical protein
VHRVEWKTDRRLAAVATDLSCLGAERSLMAWREAMAIALPESKDTSTDSTAYEQAFIMSGLDIKEQKFKDEAAASVEQVHDTVSKTPAGQQYVSANSIVLAGYMLLGYSLGPTVGLITFIGAYIYCVAEYGFLFGLGFGWLPSMILACIVITVFWLLWALAPLLLVILLILFAVIQFVH